MDANKGDDFHVGAYITNREPAGEERMLTHLARYSYTKTLFASFGQVLGDLILDISHSKVCRVDVFEGGDFDKTSQQYGVERRQRVITKPDQFGRRLAFFSKLYKKFLDAKGDPDNFVSAQTAFYTCNDFLSEEQARQYLEELRTVLKLSRFQTCIQPQLRAWIFGRLCIDEQRYEPETLVSEYPTPFREYSSASNVVSTPA